MKSYLSCSVDGKQMNGLIDVADYNINPDTESEVKLNRINVKYTGQGASGEITFIVQLNSELDGVLYGLTDITKSNPVCLLSTDTCKSVSASDELVNFVGSIGVSFQMVHVAVAKSPDFGRESAVQDKISRQYKIVFKSLSRADAIEL